MAPVLGEKLDQTSTLLEFGHIAVEIESVERFEFQGHVAVEEVTNI